MFYFDVELSSVVEVSIQIDPLIFGVYARAPTYTHRANRFPLLSSLLSAASYTLRIAMRSWTGIFPVYFTLSLVCLVICRLPELPGPLHASPRYALHLGLIPSYLGAMNWSHDSFEC